MIKVFFPFPCVFTELSVCTLSSQWLQRAFAFLVFLAGLSIRFSNPSSTRTCPSTTPACCTVALLLGLRDWACGLGLRLCCCTFKIQSGKILLSCKISLKFHSKNRWKDTFNRSLCSWLPWLLAIGAIKITNHWIGDECNRLQSRHLCPFFSFGIGLIVWEWIFSSFTKRSENEATVVTSDTQPVLFVLKCED